MCNHDWDRLGKKSIYGEYLWECKLCGAGKFEDTGTILTPIGMKHRLTTYKVLTEEDFE